MWRTTANSSPSFPNKMYRFIPIIILILSELTIAKPKEEKDRVFDKELSDKEHYKNQQHNVEYDHEAFLGKEAHSFDTIPPEESKRRLGIIVDKIDKDKDGYVTKDELKDWIEFTQKRYIVEDVDRQWSQYNPENKSTITWRDYDVLVYGFLDNSDVQNTNNEIDTYKQMRKRDRRRWSVADQDGDDGLTKQEFADFLHPEESSHMSDIVILEATEDIDKDNDGKISLQEYIGDMYTPEEPGDIEPEWVENEREQFNKYRDLNKDGFMDSDELREWILPSDFDHSDAETNHLIYEADTDADGKLTKTEILNKYDTFVGSQATDFGGSLLRHDEF